MQISADSPSPAPAGFPTRWSQVVPWLDAHSGAITAIATIVLVIVTAVYVVLTKRLAQATRDLVVEAQSDREWAYRPYLSWHVAQGAEDRTFTAANNSPAAIYQCVIVSYGSDAGEDLSWYMSVPFGLGSGDEATDKAMKRQVTPVPELDWTTGRQSRALYRNQLGQMFNCEHGSANPKIWPPPVERRRRKPDKPPWVDWYEQVLIAQKSA